MRSTLIPLALLCCTSLLFGTSKAQDLLNGAGKFETLSPEWYPVSPDSYTSTAVVAGEDGDLYLEMTKSEEASGFFDDGLVFVFKDEAGELKGVKPMHIHLEI